MFITQHVIQRELERRGHSHAAQAACELSDQFSAFSLWQSLQRELTAWYRQNYQQLKNQTVFKGLFRIVNKNPMSMIDLGVQLGQLVSYVEGLPSTILSQDFYTILNELLDDTDYGYTF